MRGQPTISARGLAEVLDGRCLRCFWVSWHVRLPEGPPFPAVFHDLDRAKKEAVRRHLDRHGKLPAWFPRVGRAVGYVREDQLRSHVYQVQDPRTGLVLCGAPDDILKMADGSYHIVDYKTARVTDRQDELFPDYEVQLNAYAHIARSLGLWPVSGLSLLYFEPTGLLELAGGTGPALGLAVRRRRVALRPRLVPRLLERAARVIALPRPPRPLSGCRDCEGLRRLRSSLRAL